MLYDGRSVKNMHLHIKTLFTECKMNLQGDKYVAVPWMAISIEYEHFASQNFATSKMAILSEFD
jgi:hypothetical protein